MRIGDKILIIDRQLVYPLKEGRNTQRVVLRRARVVSAKYNRGKRPIVYKMAGDVGEARITFGRLRGVFWCPGWDTETEEAQALIVAGSLR